MTGKKLILDQTLTDIADAIRAKTGGVASITPADMPTEIDSIPTGGGDTEILKAILEIPTVSGKLDIVSSSVESLRGYALSNHAGLRSVTLPACTKVEGHALEWSLNITSVSFCPDGVSLATSALERVQKLASFTGKMKDSGLYYPKVGNYCFRYDSALKSVDLDFVNDAETINWKIGQGAFIGCSALDTLILRCTDMVVVAEDDYSIPPKVKDGTGYVYVPQALLASYQAATNWSTYAAQFRALEDYTVDGTTTGALDPAKI